MNRTRATRLRFAVWVFAVAVPIAAGLTRFWLGDPGSAGQRAMSLAQLAGVVAMLALLKSTPSDAIKLKRRTSIVLIALGAGVICGTTTGQWTTAWPQVELTAFAVIAGLAIGTFFALQVPKRASPWWVVAFAWLPWYAVLDTHVSRGTRGGDVPVLATFLSMAFAGAAIYATGALTPTRVRWWMLVLFAAVCAAAILVV